MSRYVDRKHGLTIGSDNWFFIVGDGEEIRDGYKAIVTLRGYTFEQVSSLNVGIWTPAQQIVWDAVKYTEQHEFEGTSWESERTGYTLRKSWRHWLTENVGAEQEMWDVRSRCERRGEPIFFKQRKGAVAFCNEVDARLKGIKIGEF